MRQVIYFMLVVFLISLSGCKKNNGFVLALKSEALDKPLFIAGDSHAGGGGIFYETDDGRFWLPKKPATEVETKDGAIYKFKGDDGGIGTITLTLRKIGLDYLIRLSASAGSDEVLKWGINIRANADEYFTGLFERTVDGDQKESWKEGVREALNLRGQRVDMVIKPSLGLYAPFYLSSRGYGFFAYGTWPGHFDFCKDNKNLVRIEFEGPEFKFKIYTGKRLADIVKKHALEAGPPLLPPKWVFKPWRWRDENKNRKQYYDGTPVHMPYNSEVVEDVLMMQAYDIPCGVYWVDRPWAKGPDGYDDFQWDPDRFPKAARMIQWLKKRDIRFVLWIAPWVMGDMAKVAVEKGYNLKGQTNNTDKCALIDFSNAEAVRWWQEKGLAKLLKMGVKGFKLDRSEEIVPESRDIKACDGRAMRQIRNDYPVEYVKAAYEISKKNHGDDFILLARAAYTGSSRYAGFWGGDIASSQEGLRAAIIALLRSAIIGYPIWGSDTGGYWQGDLDREVTARWLAFSCFSPVMEVGPTENRGFWDMKKEPHYDAELIAIWRFYAKLHTRLQDYSYRFAKEAHETGMPIARPLFLVYPKQKEAWQDWQTFLYGSDILVSAIWRKGTTEHTLYLPKGEEWRDAWHPEKIYQGGQKITVHASLYQIPLFIRVTSKVDLGDLNALYAQSLKLARKKPDLSKLESLHEHHRSKGPAQNIL